MSTNQTSRVPSLESFIALDDSAIAQQLRSATRPCWAIALGGTRRAFIAQGGGASDAEGYFTWVEAAERAVLEQLYRLGVDTIVSVGRVATDRGGVYQQFSIRTLESLANSPQRTSFYDQLNLHVQFAGDLEDLGAAVGASHLPKLYLQIGEKTADRTGPRLIYLLRGDWNDPATEEAILGYQLGKQLDRAPSRDELVRAFYGEEVPPLTVYVGSGRPQLGPLRPPLLCGSEDLYWSVTSPIRLSRDDWCRLIYDHIWMRRTHSARSYPADSHARIADILKAEDGRILGLGRRHALGFWLAERP